MKNLVKLAIISMCATINPALIIAQDQEQSEATADSSSEVRQASEEVTPSRFTADGSSILIPKTQTKITPISGWEVITSTNMSVIMQEPEVEKTADDIKYQRNITVALIQNPSYMNETRMAKFVEELKDSYGKSANNYTVAESKIFDIQNHKAIMVYAAYTLNNIDLMQLNILVSDNSKQYMLTYTDLASRFSQENLFNQAWESMVSIELESDPVNPMNEMAKYAIIVLVSLIAIVSIIKARKRSASKFYEQESDSIYSDDSDDEDYSLEHTKVSKNNNQSDWNRASEDDDYSDDICSGFNF